MLNDCWSHFEHGADIGVRGTGGSREKAFEQAAMALTGVVADPGTIQPLEEVRIGCEEPDDELLLVEWLNSIIYEMATRKMLFSSFDVHIQDHRLNGKAWGERIDIGRHQPAVEIKGATCSELAVKCNEGGKWIAQCIVDV
jgi:tRNA nucleotidyltransferase (CCA-adding enzyme)